nr:carbohydrate-binding protein [Pantoea cypripedii]
MMNFKVKTLGSLIALSLLTLNVPVAKAHNDQGDKARTPNVHFSTHPNMQSSKMLSALTASMEVQEMTNEAPPWYWAYQGWYMSEGGFYFGLQPNGEYGKTALFSIFGKGTQSNVESCKRGADSTDPDTGMSCHIPYEWEVGHKYTFNVKRTGQDTAQSLTTWQGSVTDQTTGQETIIGIVSVPARWSDLQPSLLGWAEWFLNGELTCAQRTNFVVKYSGVSGVYSDTATPWQSYISDSNPNTCATYDMTGTYPTEVIMSAGGTFDGDNNSGGNTDNAPVAVVPADFSVTSSPNESIVRELDASGSKNADSYSWKVVGGKGSFWLQEEEKGGWVSALGQAKVRALFPANSSGTAIYELTVSKNGKQDTKRVTITVTAPENPTTPDQPGTEFPEWQAGTPYVAGDKVTYEGIKYVAKYWTLFRPGYNDAWKLANPSQITEWKASMAYSGGDSVIYQGKTYKAAYWTQGNTPGQHSVWLVQ